MPTQEQIDLMNDGYLEFWSKRTNEDGARFYRACSRFIALRRADPDMADRLHEQRRLFNAACAGGQYQEIEIHGSALCRGYMEALAVIAEQKAFMLQRKGNPYRSAKEEMIDDDSSRDDTND